MSQVRAETSVESDEVPGVSMIVVRANAEDGQSTSMRSTESAVYSPRSNVSLPSRRVTGTLNSAPFSAVAVTCGVVPFRYQVTTRVHSVASVGAISCPTSELSSVDLPALREPASATRSGSSSLAAHSSNWARVCG